MCFGTLLELLFLSFIVIAVFQQFLKVFCRTSLFQHFIDERTAELAANNFCLTQTQFDLDVLREVPKDSPQFIDALRSPIPNHLPVRWLVAEQQQSLSLSQSQRSDVSEPPPTDEVEDSTRDSPGKALLPEDAPLRRGFFALHDLFSPEHPFDPTAVASAGASDDLSDMPGLGPVIVQNPPLLLIDEPMPCTDDSDNPFAVSPTEDALEALCEGVDSGFVDPFAF